MSARTSTLAVLASAALALAAAGCAEPDERHDGTVTVEIPSVEVDDERDGWDCEDEPGDRERDNQETPDCGRKVPGVGYVEWTWVAAGYTAPPPGWSPARDPRPTPSAAASTRQTKKATPSKARPTRKSN